MFDRRTLLLLLAGAAALPACTPASGTGGAVSGSTVLSVARSNRLGRFLRAVDATGLDATLSSAGPYTVFAPSDRAFAAARLPRDPDQLRAIIAYHVVPGTFTSTFLGIGDVNYTTLQGSSLNVDGRGALRVNGAAVTRADLEASNGVVHIIDRVLTPR